MTPRRSIVHVTVDTVRTALVLPALVLCLAAAGCAMGDVPEIPELGTWDVRPRPDPTLDGDLDAGPSDDLAELDTDDATDADDAEPFDLPVPLDLPPIDTGRDVPPPPGDRGCAADPARACTPGQARNCGRCGSQVCTEACAWTDCAGEGECAAGQTRSCGGCGTQRCSSTCAWEACPTQGECTPGQTRACGNCGRQTCTTGCQWGTCTGMGECAPGQTRAGTCDRCSQQTCTSACTWGACGLRPGNACEYRSGTNNRACGQCRCGRQWCLDSCQWSTACTSCCSGCGGCLAP